MVLEKKSCVMLTLIKFVEKYHKNKILSRSNIYFIQLTLLDMTSKVVKTEKGFSYTNISTFYQSHNYVFKLFKNHKFCGK